MRGVAFHPTKNLVASCSYDKSIKLWNADTGAELWTVRGHTKDNEECICEFYSSGGLRTRRAECPVRGHSEQINSVAFSPDGQFIASCSGAGAGRDNSVRVWNAETGEQLWQLTGHTR